MGFYDSVPDAPHAKDSPNCPGSAPGTKVPSGCPGTVSSPLRLFRTPWSVPSSPRAPSSPMLKQPVEQKRDLFSCKVSARTPDLDSSPRRNVSHQSPRVWAGSAHTGPGARPAPFLPSGGLSAPRRAFGSTSASERGFAIGRGTGTRASMTEKTRALTEGLRSQVAQFNGGATVDTDSVEGIAMHAENGWKIYTASVGEVSALTSLECPERGELIDLISAGMTAVFTWAMRSMAVINGELDAQNQALLSAIELLESQNDRWQNVSRNLKVDLVWASQVKLLSPARLGVPRSNTAGQWRRSSLTHLSSPRSRRVAPGSRGDAQAWQSSSAGPGHNVVGQAVETPSLPSSTRTRRISRPLLGGRVTAIAALATAGVTWGTHTGLPRVMPSVVRRDLRLAPYLVPFRWRGGTRCARLMGR